MVREGQWFTTVKRALIPQCCQRDLGRSVGKSKLSDSLLSNELEANAAQLLPVPVEDVELTVKEDEHSNHTYSVALASVVAAEAAVVAAQAAAEVIRLTTLTTRLSGKSRQEIAATKIQAAFRGYLARRSWRAVRGLLRLKRLVDKSAVKSQTANTLRCLQTLARVQTQLHSRRNSMTDQNQALQRKYEKEPVVKIGEGWNDSAQSKEQAETKLLNKQEAAVRRDRALAYAFSDQWKSSTRSLHTEASNLQWGWGWLAHWMAARPNNSTMEINDRATNSANCNVMAQTRKHRDTSLDCTPSVAQKSSQSSSQESPATPRSKTPLTASTKKSVSPRGGRCSVDSDLRSKPSFQPEQRRRRHSIAGPLMTGGESLVSSLTTPSYMALTESARARSRFHGTQSYRPETSKKGSISLVKKHLTFPVVVKSNVLSSARTRRHSWPVKR
ncbi:hypothetical protein OPV22_021795 [Ensete ventricosum]|uniref:DUF4005 domain-containing protein n=1 Tax=Ensete ventricosum TaxID=4639 RepID=A0AAV8QM03_ENSVE|nr:hypothetical protein OPV22_021795 [Ensete ventricosum]